MTDEVTFTAEIRSHSMDKLKNEAAHMEECLKAACLEMGAAYEIERELAYPSLVPHDSPGHGEGRNRT